MKTLKIRKMLKNHISGKGPVMEDYLDECIILTDVLERLCKSIDV